MANHFYAMLSRMKYIERWALMRNSQSENISEHSLEVAILSHALAVLGKVRLGKDLDEKKAVMIAMYHDATEIITGDMPTPIKYYSDDIKEAFKKLEDEAAKRLLHMLPEDMRGYYEELFFPTEADAYLCKLVKAADKLSALIKCLEEKKAGNTEFNSAERTLRQAVIDMNLEEANLFMEEFLESYNKTLDELS